MDGETTMTDVPGTGADGAARPIASAAAGRPLVGVISNVKATRNRRRLAVLRDRLARTPGVVHYEIEQVADIPRALRLFAACGVRLLAINAGDGTVQATISILHRDSPFAPDIPPIVVLAGGKTNLIARDLGTHGRPERVLARLAALATDEDALAGLLVRRSTIAISGHEGNAPLSGMFFGLAGVVGGIRWARRRIHPLGLPDALENALAILLLAVSTLLPGRSPLTPSGARIVVDGQNVIEGRFTIILATTVARLLLGLRLMPHAGEGIQFCAVEPGASRLMKGLWALARGRLHRTGISGIHLERARRIEIETSGLFVIDGEYHPVGRDGRLRLEATPPLSFVSLRREKGRGRHR